jgi:hypothetical protein
MKKFENVNEVPGIFRFHFSHSHIFTSTHFFVVSTGIEPVYQVPETCVLSIVLRDPC